MTAELSSAEAMDAAFTGRPCLLVTADGRRRPMTADLWSGPASPADLELLVDPCDGPTLDVGCGPGRLAGALAARAIRVLGIDISAVAVRQTRARGADALRHDVFDDLPVPDRWQHVLLADGNVGLGGQPVRLLRRVAALLVPGGTVLVELSGSGALAVHENVHLQVDGRSTGTFSWATVGEDAIDEVAVSAGLVVDGVRHAGGRQVATLRHPLGAPALWHTG
ncbi:class I SAM-dependent methyltransferase [Nocardioides dongkuii]|uniref:methyltransferase domain-containing protein n=1 Tax=Nocardioides dongkuii TaxID=2760089 RepID=UPI001C703837|nr:class I SAM-dependent methyltransferase [Nocardioides dongkuii]